MKRILLFLGFCLILPFGAKSQLTKKYWLVGGTGSFFSYNDDFTTTGSPTVSGKLTEVNLSAHVGYFLWDKFAAGLRPGISSTKSRGLNSASAGTKNVTFFLGPFARYYLLNKEKQFNFLIDGVYQWGSHSNYGANGTFRNASIMAGPELFFNTSVGIEILMGYLYQNKTIKNDQPGFSNVRKGFYMSAGFQIHLAKIESKIMKKILLALVFLPISILIDAQSISLGTDNEYCPNIEYEFTVTLPEPYYSISATQMTITKDPYSFNTAYTSFKFKAKFKDANVKQFVVIRYKSDGTGYYTPEYKRVKSLFYNNNQTCGNIQPKFTSNNNPATTFNAPLCQVSNFSITFSKIKWFTDFEPSAYCFGEIADYEYQLPAGWMIGSNTSTGSNWIQGTNSVTITSDLATGNGARIFIRPKNTCGTNLNNYQVPASIVVLRAAAALTISASPNTVACGSTSPVVFTIDNTSSLTGITGYMWDLGNNNNWTYNGSPAPSSIYTTTNTLTLSPVCGTSLVSPSASVILTNAGNTCNIPVPAPTLTVTAPSLSIQGTQSLCSGTENYLIVGAPCNSPAIWSIEPGTGIANLNLTNGVSTSLTKVSDGKIVLTAKVASCGTEYSATLPIQVGTYTSSDFTLTASSGSNGYLSWCPNTTYGFTLGGPASNYSWYYPTGWTPNYISGYVCAIRSPSTSYPPTGDVSCTFTEPCGTSISKTIFVAYSSSGCSPITEPAYTYWPNPVTYSISVSVSSANMGLITIRAIEIVNASNYMTVFSQNYGTGVTNTSVTTYYYQPGNYLLRVYDGTTWRTYQFVKM